MAGEKRTGVRQAFMKQSFMRRRTTAIYDCWLDPLAGARSGFWTEGPDGAAPSARCWATSPISSTVTARQGKLRPNFSQLETRIHHEHQIRQVDPPDVRTARHDRTLRSRTSSGKRKRPRHLLRHLKLRLRRTLQQRIQNLHQDR